MLDQKNTLIAIVLSAVVLLGWQFFIGMPQMERQRQQQAAQQQQQAAQQQAAQQQQQSQQRPQAQSSATPGVAGPQTPGTPGAAPAPGAAAAAPMTREAALAASPRIQIDTPRLAGSIPLRGARIDDLALRDYRETVDPKSPAIVLLAPSGSPSPFYAEFGWVAGGGAPLKLPDAQTEWQREGAGTLTIDRPVTLTWDNGEGLLFRRVISVDDRYLFTVKDEVQNTGANPVTLFPYALISRHGTPHTQGYYILHEGLIGVLNDKLQEVSYSSIDDKKSIAFDTTNGWLGITDKYWAATLLPDTSAHLKARFAASVVGNAKNYQTDYLLDAVTVAPGASATTSGRLF
ncbi:MAG: membrane protein insertase YidC, partial [Rhizobiales bacterium]|nr:membrane protein insertase YidC [Hyphomicrobiales bacterium]